MSYDISRWRTKVLEDFSVPLAEIEKLPHVKIELRGATGIAVTNSLECFELLGDQDSATIRVRELSVGGDGSGSSWDALLHLFRQSAGKLIATQVWEGGDSITRLTVIGGVVTEETVEL